jgi:hypothetical protein
LQLYATDALETSSGGFGLLQPGVTPTGVGAWVSIPASASSVQVPAERSTGPGYVIVPMTVRVPVKAIPGDHVGGVIASLRTVGTNATGQTVVLNQRIGSRVYVRVAGQLSPQLTLSSPRATFSGSSSPVGTGRVKVSYVVTNSGNVDLAVHDQHVSVSGLIDDTHTAQLGNIQLLLPGTSVTQSVVISGVWPQFRLHQTVSAQPVVLDGSAGDLSPVGASSTLWAVPWLLVIIVLVLVVAVVAWVRRRRHKVPAQPSRRSAGSSWSVGSRWSPSVGTPAPPAPPAPPRRRRTPTRTLWGPSACATSRASRSRAEARPPRRSPGSPCRPPRPRRRTTTTTARPSSSPTNLSRA